MVELPKPEPLAAPDARKLIQEIVKNGAVGFSAHAEKEMAKDDLQTTDCLNVMRGGIVGPGELIDGTWRYRISTPHMCVVVAFPSATKLRVVTVWRK